MPPRENHEEAGDTPVASANVLRIRLTPETLRALRLTLLTQPLVSGCDLVEECYANGDVVVRLSRPDKPWRGEPILGHRRETQDPERLFGS